VRLISLSETTGNKKACRKPLKEIFSCRLINKKKYLYGSYYDPDSPMPTRKRFIPFFLTIVILEAIALTGYLNDRVIFAWLFTFLVLAVAIFTGIRFFKVIIDDKTAQKIK